MFRRRIFSRNGRIEKSQKRAPSFARIFTQDIETTIRCGTERSAIPESSLSISCPREQSRKANFINASVRLTKTPYSIAKRIASRTISGGSNSNILLAPQFEGNDKTREVNLLEVLTYESNEIGLTPSELNIFEQYKNDDLAKDIKEMNGEIVREVLTQPNNLIDFNHASLEFEVTLQFPDPTNCETFFRNAGSSSSSASIKTPSPVLKSRLTEALLKFEPIVKDIESEMILIPALEKPSANLLEEVQPLSPRSCQQVQQSSFYPSQHSVICNNSENAHNEKSLQSSNAEELLSPFPLRVKIRSDVGILDQNQELFSSQRGHYDYLQPDIDESAVTKDEIMNKESAKRENREMFFSSQKFLDKGSFSCQNVDKLGGDSTRKSTIRFDDYADMFYFDSNIPLVSSSCAESLPGASGNSSSQNLPASPKKSFETQYSEEQSTINTLSNRKKMRLSISKTVSAVKSLFSGKEKSSGSILKIRSNENLVVEHIQSLRSSRIPFDEFWENFQYSQKKRQIAGPLLDNIRNQQIEHYYHMNRNCSKHEDPEDGSVAS